MKRISFSIFLVVAFALLYYAQPVIALQQEKGIVGLANLPRSTEKEWSEEESEEIAEHFLRNSPTFVSRGIGDSLKLLAITPLDKPFSWQFDYEFQCQYPGYGRLGSEPTPPDITRHEARIVVQEGEVTYAVLDEEWDVLLAISNETSSQEESAPTSPATFPEGNLINVSFMEEYHYKVSGDSFMNEEVTIERWWRTNLQNLPDETGAPVTGLRLALDSEVSFGGVEEEFMTMRGPPTYEWFLGDIPDGETVVHTGGYWGWDAYVRCHSTSKLVPGYDVSRSFDKTVFSAPGVQTLTITLTPREESIDTVTIFVHTDEDAFVDPVVLSYSSTSGGEVKIEQGGHRSGIHSVPVELDTPLVVTVNLQVTPKVPLVHYKPGTEVLPHRVSVPDNGITIGNSVSFTTEVVTWTWSADGDYVWHWIGPHGPSVSVSFGRGSSFPISILILSGIGVVLILAGLAIYRIRRKRGSTH